MRQPPKELTKGIRYLVDSLNSLREFVLQTRVIPTTGWTETSDGLLPPPYEKASKIDPFLSATGLLAESNLEAIFEQNTIGSSPGNWVASNHADGLELFSSMSGAEPRWYIVNSGGTIWYKSQTSNIFGNFDKVGSPSPSQGTAPATITLVSFPGVLSYDDGAAKTIYYQQGSSGNANFDDTGFTVGLDWNSGSGEWQEQSGFTAISSNFSDPRGTSGSITVSAL